MFGGVGRADASSDTDDDGGGDPNGSSRDADAFLDDLWRYSVADARWTWCGDGRSARAAARKAAADKKDDGFGGDADADARARAWPAPRAGHCANVVLAGQLVGAEAAEAYGWRATAPVILIQGGFTTPTPTTPTPQGGERGGGARGGKNKTKNANKNANTTEDATRSTPRSAPLPPRTLGDAWAYAPETGRWTKIPPRALVGFVPKPRGGHRCVEVGAGGS